MNDIRQEVEQVEADAELLYSDIDVEAALNVMAKAITDELQNENPLVICLMLGAIVVTGKLLTRLNFPLQLEYIHATRYRGETQGGELEFIKIPEEKIRGRTVLVIDDILDEGITMRQVVDACNNAGAGKVYTAVLVDKQLDKAKQFASADFTGLTVPDRYVFGYGMDYRDYLRNSNGIYAVKES